MRKSLKYSVLVLVFMLVSNVTWAQCAMCRSTVASTISDGRNDVGNGLNFGILYMLSFPYLVTMVGLYLWYRKAKKNQWERMALEKRLREII